MSFLFFISIVPFFLNFNVLNNVKNFELLVFISYFNIVSLLLIAYLAFIIITVKNKMKFNIIYFIFFPFYWILHYIAGVRAFYYLITRPFYWSKTKHGVK
ncbi:MAG TPA: hypothetical protein VLL98_05200 [Rickettsiales bacterium]|nr:hypothetical protein [Rickettsiales bacterium]